jgi:hypothetical protein
MPGGMSCADVQAAVPQRSGVEWQWSLRSDFSWVECGTRCRVRRTRSGDRGAYLRPPGKADSRTSSFSSPDVHLRWAATGRVSTRSATRGMLTPDDCDLE